jgi:hypothetical protein
MARTTPPTTRTNSPVRVTESGDRRISAPIAALIVNITRTTSAAFTVEFESEEELREELRTNLSLEGLRLGDLRGRRNQRHAPRDASQPMGGESLARATVVATLPEGIALASDGKADEHLARLMTRPDRRFRTVKNDGLALRGSPIPQASLRG